MKKQATLVANIEHEVDRHPDKFFAKAEKNCRCFCSAFSPPGRHAATRRMKMSGQSTFTKAGTQLQCSENLRLALKHGKTLDEPTNRSKPAND
jgi:hypothetical protein